MGELADEIIDRMLEWGNTYWEEPRTPNVRYDRQLGHNTQRPEFVKNAADMFKQVCGGCGNEVDPDWCHCGDAVKGHSMWSGHGPIPMGCTCGYVKSE